MTQDQQRALALKASEAARAQKWISHAADNGGKTGWGPGMLQDDSRELSRALAKAPHARRHVREVCAALPPPPSDTGAETP